MPSARSGAEPGRLRFAPCRRSLTGAGEPSSIPLLICRAPPSREIVPQGGCDPLQRPVDLIGGDHKWRRDADRVAMGVLGKDASALQGLAVAAGVARFR